jgi:Na+/H+ antiporter NhaA
VSDSQRAAKLEGRTAWARSVQTPLRDFLHTETGSAAVLLAATLAALAWVNIDAASYEAFWQTTLSIRVGGAALGQDLRHWVNSGLMTFFFFVIGLEARREFDMGELRQRSRAMLPLVAGIGGMVVPVLIYLAFNAGRGSVRGWGAAMSTDTAFALGVLALVGARKLVRLRAFLLTVVVIDDVIALVVIAVVYTQHLVPGPLLAALGLFALVLLARALHVDRGVVFAVLGLAIWVALFESGVEPVVVGLAMGLLTYASPAARTDLEAATERFRSFREQPTPELARSAQAGVRSAISLNDRLQHLYHPWTSYLIVPLFALANAGIVVSGGFIRTAFASPITLGIMIGYVVGKPVGVIGASWLVAALSRGRLRPQVGWASVVGGGTIAGIGFTVSLLIASLVFNGRLLEEAKLGVITGALAAAVVTWVVFRITAILPQRSRARALLGTAAMIVDLEPSVDAARDHLRGPRDAPVTLVEYGDFECPYCGLAEEPIRELLADRGDVAYVWRHLPLNDVHPWAQLAAEASEAAAAQGAFWPMHDALLAHQGALRTADLARYAEELGLDVARFEHDRRRHAGASRIAEDVDSADLSGVSGTPSFFVNGRRLEGAYDITSLRAAAKTARARVAIEAAPARGKAA